MFKIMSTVEKSECGNLPVIPNGRAMLDQSNSREQSALVTCEKGYTAEVPRLTCLKGKWHADGSSLKSICAGESSSVSSLSQVSLHKEATELNLIFKYVFQPTPNTAKLHLKWRMLLSRSHIRRNIWPAPKWLINAVMIMWWRENPKPSASMEDGRRTYSAQVRTAKEHFTRVACGELWVNFQSWIRWMPLWV